MRLKFALLALAVGLASAPVRAEESSVETEVPSFVPGKGFNVARNELGSLNISAYALLRYLNQLPAGQSFQDHLGRYRLIDPRQDIQLHRVLIHLTGFLLNPRFTYQASVWAVNSTNSVTAFGVLNYKFTDALTIGGGIGALPGTRSLNYEHPYFLGTDRQMADEYFRPSFTSGVWVQGEPISRFHYRLMLGNNLNTVDIGARQLSRDFATGATVFWMPTTGEFGPKGGFGDFEDHELLATRFGLSAAHSRENQQSQGPSANNFPENTTIKISDSLTLFDPGTLADGVTMINADFNLLAVDASAKYRGFFVFLEGYFRHLSKFNADGPLPISVIRDYGWMLQGSYMVTPKKWEAYLAHSQIYGQFNRALELTLGTNYYPFRSRSLKVNGSVTYVDRSPASSLFGYFVGGEKGPIIAISTDYYF